MGQKINPIGLRVGVIRNWDSRWYASGQKFADNIYEDYLLRKYVKQKLKNSGVSKVEIERTGEQIKMVIFTARPGLVIGKKGAGIDALQLDIQKQTKHKLSVSIQEVRKPDLDSQLVAENIALQLQKRVSWRRVLKKSIAAAIRQGVRGIKIRISGRLDGAEIARSEWYNEKSIPLHTLRANIDYGFAESLTTYGIIGVKVWMYYGDVYLIKDVAGGGKNAQS